MQPIDPLKFTSSRSKQLGYKATRTRMFAGLRCVTSLRVLGLYVRALPTFASRIPGCEVQHQNEEEIMPPVQPQCLLVYAERGPNNQEHQIGRAAELWGQLVPPLLTELLHPSCKAERAIRGLSVACPQC